MITATRYTSPSQLSPIAAQEPQAAVNALAKKLAGGDGVILHTPNGILAVSFEPHNVMFVHHATSAKDITDNTLMFLSDLAMANNAKWIAWESRQSNLALSKMYIRLGAAIVGYDGTYIHWRIRAW